MVVFKQRSVSPALRRSDRKVEIGALAGVIVKSYIATHSTSLQRSIITEGLPGNCWGIMTEFWCLTCDGLASRSGKKR